VTVKFNQKARYVDLRITEYASMSFISGQSGTGVSTSASSGSLSTTSSNALLFAAGMTSQAFSSSGSGYTLRVITNPDADIVEDRMAGSAGSYNATAPLSSSGS